MARHKNQDWTLPGPQIENWQQVSVAVLMDIRDELQALNRLLHCQNFTGMPADLRQINKRLAQKVKLPRGRS